MLPLELKLYADHLDGEFRLVDVRDNSTALAVPMDDDDSFTRRLLEEMVKRWNAKEQQ